MKYQNLKKKIDLLELKENMVAKNKSYLEAKVQKDVDQVKENQKLQMKGKNDNQENSSSNRRKKVRVDLRKEERNV